jgi:Rho-binding antiterminator
MTDSGKTIKLHFGGDPMSSRRHIRCADYDYIEIMCLHRYRVTVTMKDLTLYEGQFHTTRIIELEGKKREAMVGIDINQARLQLMLEDISCISVHDDKAQFAKLLFD